jgi:hypothetical protein
MKSSLLLRDCAGSDAVSNAIGYLMHRSRSHDAVIRVYDDAGNVIETHEHKAISASSKVRTTATAKQCASDY